MTRQWSKQLAQHMLIHLQTAHTVALYLFNILISRSTAPIALNCPVGRRGNERQISIILLMKVKARHTDRRGDVELKVSSWMPDRITTKRVTQKQHAGLVSWHLSLLPSVTLQVCCRWMEGTETMAILAARKPSPVLCFVRDCLMKQMFRNTFHLLPPSLKYHCLCLSLQNMQ